MSERVVINPELTGKQLFDFLRANKQQLIDQKKALPKRMDAVSFIPELYATKNGVQTKLEPGEQIAPDVNSVHVKVVGNTSMWCDSHMDVLLKNSADKSLKERKGHIPLIKNHDYVIEAQIAENEQYYYQDVSLRELGLNKAGSAQCLICEADVMREYDERVFKLYKAKKINQHSIGLQYTKIGLAINDEEDTAHFDLWNKHINDVINKEVCEEKGYFWVVPEYKLLELSAVLFGSNILTPTLDVKADTETKPPTGTPEQPFYMPKVFNLDEAIKSTKFFN